jgi:hypothetical protein
VLVDTASEDRALAFHDEGTGEQNLAAGAATVALALDGRIYFTGTFVLL